MGQDGYTLIVGRHLIGMRPTYESNVAMDSLDFDGGLFCWKNYSDRYTGPFRPISRVQDLPLEAKSGRPKIPVAWSNKNRQRRGRNAGWHATRQHRVSLDNSIGMKFVGSEAGTLTVTLAQGNHD
jgi:hypothetical protein